MELPCRRLESLLSGVSQLVALIRLVGVLFYTVAHRAVYLRKIHRLKIYRRGLIREALTRVTLSVFASSTLLFCLA